MEKKRKIKDIYIEKLLFLYLFLGKNFIAYIKGLVRIEKYSIYRGGNKLILISIKYF